MDPEEIEEQADEELLEGEEIEDEGREEAEVTEEEAEGDLAGYKTEAEVPIELRPTWRNLHKDYTRKTQHLAATRKEIEAIEAAGFNLGQVRQVIEALNENPQAFAPAQGNGATTAPKVATEDELEKHPDIAELRQFQAAAPTDWDKARLEREIRTAKRGIQREQQAEIQRMANEQNARATEIKAQLTQLSADPVLGPHLQTPAAQARLLRHAQQEGFRTLKAAAKDLLFDEVRQAGTTAAAAKKATQDKAVKGAAISGGKTAANAKPPAPQGRTMAEIHTFNMKNDPNYRKLWK